MQALFVLLAVLIGISVIGILVSVVAAVRMCINREEPFEPLDEDDYDDPAVQMELCGNENAADAAVV